MNEVDYNKIDLNDPYLDIDIHFNLKCRYRAILLRNINLKEEKVFSSGCEREFNNKLKYKNQEELEKADAELRQKLNWWGGNPYYKRIVRGFKLTGASKMSRCRTVARWVYDDAGHRFIETNKCKNLAYCSTCGEEYALESAARVKHVFEEVVLKWGGLKYRRVGEKKIRKFKVRIIDVVFTTPAVLRGKISVNELDLIADKTLTRFYSELKNVELFLGGCTIKHCWGSNAPWEEKPHIRKFFANIGFDKKNQRWRELPCYLKKEDLDRLKQIYREELERATGISIEEVVVEYQYHKDVSNLPIAYEMRAISHDLIKGIVGYDRERGIILWQYSEEVDGVWVTREVEVPWIQFARVFKIIEKDKAGHRITWFGFLSNANKSKFFALMEKGAVGEIIQNFQELLRNWDFRVQINLSTVKFRLNQNLRVRELVARINAEERKRILKYISDELAANKHVCPLCGLKLRVGGKISLSEVYLVEKIGKYYSFISGRI
jgi:hypothetical protein